MDVKSLSQERTKLCGLLAKYESGQIMHSDDGEEGLLRHENTAERCERLKARIAEIDRRLIEDRRNA